MPNERLANLMAAVQACTVCSPHLPWGPRPVLQMHPDARVLIAAQAPGRKVHETGIPFDDASGARLRDWLGLPPAVFYDAQQVAILPMAFCFPGRGRSGDLPPRPECAQHWRERLMAQLTQVRLTLVIGRHAQRYHLPDAAPVPLAQLVHDSQTTLWPEVVVLPHPSPRNNIWLKRHPWFESTLVPAIKPLVRRALSD